MRKYVEIKNEYEIKQKFEELDKEYGLKNLFIPDGIKDEFKSKAYVDLKTITGDIVMVEGRFKLLKEFLKKMR